METIWRVIVVRKHPSGEWQKAFVLGWVIMAKDHPPFDVQSFNASGHQIWIGIVDAYKASLGDAHE